MPTVLQLADASSIHSVRWANAISKRGWKVHLLSLRPPREALDGRITLHCAPWKPRAGYILNVGYVRNKVRQLRPDLIHAHYASGYGTLAALADCHPLIISVWGADVYDFPQTTPLHSWLIQRNLQRADVVLSTSEVMAIRARQFTDRKVGITPFGIDLQRFHPKDVESPFGASSIVIGTVKTLADKYGIEYLIRAFDLVKRRRPLLPLKLLLVGSGPQEGALKRLVADLGLQADTIFTGRVSHAFVPDYHNMLSVAVFLSTQESESFGVAVLEASACGKPVVVSGVGGLTEVVDSGVTGIVVPARNPDRAADAIERLVTDDRLRLALGAAGRQRVKDLYEWEHCVDVMIECYCSLVERARSGHLLTSVR